MPLLTPTELKARGVETDLADAVLEDYIAEAEAMLERVAGPSGLGPFTEDLIGGGGVIFPRRRVATITSVSALANDGTTTALEAATYRVQFGGLGISRLSRLPWPTAVRLVYVPADDDEIRKGIVTRLVRCALSHRGLITGERAGSWSAQYGDDYERARERILDPMRPAFGGVA